MNGFKSINVSWKEVVIINEIKEEWKPLNYKGLDLGNKYLISNTGRVYSLLTNKNIKTHIHKRGYRVFAACLGSRKQRTTLRVNIAVACAFVDGYKEGLVVNHKDGNKLNNIYTNLEWVTQKENIHHAVKMNHVSHAVPIGQFDINNNLIRTFCTIQEASRFMANKINGTVYNISQRIRRALNKENRILFGYKWKKI